MATKRSILTSTRILLIMILAISVSLPGCLDYQETNGEAKERLDNQVPNGETELSAEEAKMKAMDYINTNLVTPGTNASAVSVEDKGSLYKVVASYQGNEVPLWISKDGEQLFLRALSMSSTKTETQQYLTAQEAKTMAINYVNDNLDLPNTVNAVSVKEKKYVYEVVTEYQGNEVPLYVSNDGAFLLFGALNTSEELPKSNMTPAITPIITPTPPSNSTEELQKFVNCLNEAGMKIYGSKRCSHCQELVHMLGGYNLVDPIYIECTENQNLCQEKGVRAYPTIIINGTEYRGTRTYEALSEATGCPVPQK